MWWKKVKTLKSICHKSSYHRGQKQKEINTSWYVK